MPVPNQCCAASKRSGRFCIGATYNRDPVYFLLFHSVLNFTGDELAGRLLIRSHFSSSSDMDLKTRYTRGSKFCYRLYATFELFRSMVGTVDQKQLTIRNTFHQQVKPVLFAVELHQLITTFGYTKALYPRWFSSSADLPHPHEW